MTTQRESIEDLKRAVILLSEHTDSVPPDIHQQILEFLGDYKPPVLKVERTPEAGEIWWYGDHPVIVTHVDAEDGWYHVIHPDGSVDDTAQVDDFGVFVCEADMGFMHFVEEVE
jgi:hypothetical protein